MRAGFVALALILSPRNTAGLAALFGHRCAIHGPGSASTAATCSSQRRPLVTLSAAPSADHPKDPKAVVEEVPYDAQLASLISGAELAQMRDLVELSRRELEMAIARQDFGMAAEIRDRVRDMEATDPDVLAADLSRQLNSHVGREDYAAAGRVKYQLVRLRRFQPQYQLAGLWEGEYPNGEVEMIRIHYKGDQLYAVKQKGDAHVPKGKVTFQADLAKCISTSEYADEAEPSRDRAEERDTDAPTATKEPPKKPTPKNPPKMEEMVGKRVSVVEVLADGVERRAAVERFTGEGCVAAKGYRDAHFVHGQLLLMDENALGFLWVPLGTMVTFKRAVEAEEVKEVLDENKYENENEDEDTDEENLYEDLEENLLKNKKNALERSLLAMDTVEAKGGLTEMAGSFSEDGEGLYDMEEEE